MAETYRVFKRSCKNWKQFARARKFTQERSLTYAEAREYCERCNAQLTLAQKHRGTRYEFEQE